MMPESTTPRVFTVSGIEVVRDSQILESGMLKATFVATKTMKQLPEML